jgi:hypothetical protein
MRLQLSFESLMGLDVDLHEYLFARLRHGQISCHHLDRRLFVVNQSALDVPSLS